MGPGSYRLYHLWPTPLVVGFLVTGFTVLLAGSLLLMAISPERVLAPDRRRRFDGAVTT